MGRSPIATWSIICLTTCELFMELLRNWLTLASLAGSDTTAISLRACFYYLMKTPSTYKKLLAEIDDADSKGMLSPSVTYEECSRLLYL